MRRGIGILALFLLLAALGTGGFYVWQSRFPWEPSAPPPAPAPPTAAVAAPTALPAELPPPTLTGEAPAAPPAGEAIATLVGFERSVKSKRASDLTWEDAKPQLSLYDNDAVRTFEKSSATISFGPNDIVEVEENALVVIKPRSSQGEGDEISLALLSADLLKELEAKPAAEQTQAIAAAAAKRELTIRPVAAAGKAAGKTRIAIRSMPDRSTTVAALTGGLKIVGPKGGEVVLKEKMVTKISEAGLVAQPRVLPGAPDLVSPRDGENYPFLRKAPKVDLAWKSVDRARGYHVVVATDAAFRKIFAYEKVDGTAFSVHNLQPGTYYWRVRATDPDGFEGPYSSVRSVKALVDDTPPPLAILSPPEMFVSPSPSVEIKGRTEKDARVKINGQKVSVAADGSFSLPVTLKEGVNLVTIEAVDQAGNAEYGKRFITYKGAKRSATASVSGNR